MTTYSITPGVDAVREFLEIAGDFTNPLEVVREAISNSIDARASLISIQFNTVKKAGNRILVITIDDNGVGMGQGELQAFFDLGNSTKRKDSQTIGEKGHGTKVFFNCARIAVDTIKDGRRLVAEMINPYASLHDGNLPVATVVEGEETGGKLGTTITLEGFNNNQSEKFTHARLKDYVQWFTKFGSVEREFGIQAHADCSLRLKGLDVTDPEVVTFGHHFPEPSKSMEKLFDEHLVRAPDFFCKRIVRRGNLRRSPEIKFEAVFSIEGNRVKQSYNPMLRRSGYSAPPGAYTVQERYGLWVCKDFIPIERKNEWISVRGTEFTRFHAFLNCQDFSLTANRGSVANSRAEILEDIQEVVQTAYDEIIDGDDWREMEWLESEAETHRTIERESNDFEWRKERANKSNTASFKDCTLCEPSRESGVYALLVQLELLAPGLFPFQIVDYDTHTGIDVIVVEKSKSPVSKSALYYVEIKFFLEKTMNHSFANMKSIVCWDTKLKNGDRITDISGEERTLKILPPDKESAYTGYFLQRDRKQDIEVFVLKDYLREKLALEFRPRTKMEVV